MKELTKKKIYDTLRRDNGNLDSFARLLVDKKYYCNVQTAKNCLKVSDKFDADIYDEYVKWKEEGYGRKDKSVIAEIYNRKLKETFTNLGYYNEKVH